jgi:hypothetical protein
MRLPEKYEKNNTLENMDNYTSCYVVSRALWVDQDNECHLDENAF